MEQNVYEREINIGTLFNIVWRKAWIIILAAIIAAGVVFKATPQVTEESYTAETSLYISYVDEYAENKPSLTTAINSCAALVKNYEILESIRQELRLPMTDKELMDAIDIQPVKDASILSLSVKADDESEAVSIATAVAGAAELQIGEMIGYVSCKQVGNVVVTPSISSTNVLKYSVAAAVVAAFVVTVFFVCKELFDRTIKDGEEASAYTGVVSLGVIPELKDDRRKKESRPHALETAGLPFAYTEAYKALRTNFMFRSSNDNAKSVVITSSVLDEDVYNTAVNLASSLACAGKRTVLVDCNMRAGMLDKYLDIAATAGLADILTGSAAIKDCKTVANNGLKAVKAGSPVENPSELLSSENMKQLIRTLEAENDYVLLVAPPASIVTDSSVLSTMTDGVLLVVRTRFARLETVQLAVQNLRAVDGNILGLVLTRFDIKKLYTKNGYSSVLKTNVKI